MLHRCTKVNIHTPEDRYNVHTHVHKCTLYIIYVGVSVCVEIPLADRFMYVIGRG